MEKKYGKSVAQQLSNPRNYISRSQADAMGLGTEKGTKQYNLPDIRGIVEEVGKNKESAYDKEYWDQFLKLDPELTGYRFIQADDPEVLSALEEMPSAGSSLYYMANQPAWSPRHNTAQRDAIHQKKKTAQITIALYVNQIMEKQNAPLIQAVEQQERQLEIDQAVKLALEQKVRETATPKPTPEPTPKPTPTPTAPAVISSFPIIPIIIIAVIVGIFFLRRRA